MLRKAIKLAVVLAFAACMLISCTPEPSGKPDSGSMGYASFSKQSRDLSTSYETALYSGLYWFYDSEKADGYGKTGEAENAKVPGRLDVAPSDSNYAKGLNGLVGPFSMGSWNFTLKAYSSAHKESETWVPDEGTLVYMGSANNVIIRDGETKYVPVSVTPQGDNGTIIFEDAYFRWKDENGEYAPAYARLDLYEGSNLAHTINLSVASSPDERGGYKITTNAPVAIPAKYYKAVAVAQIDLADGTTSEVATEAFSLRVYGNAKTKVYGNLYESVFSKVYFEAAEQDMAVFTPSGDSVISVKPTPVADPAKNTTAKFPSGTLQNNATYQLDVQVVASVSANSKYGISGVNRDRKNSYAGLDIKLYLVTIEADGTVRQTPVTQFTTPVEVSTFIEKGLENVSVHYNGTGAEPTDVVYNGETGQLTFKASHFSEYYVMAEACAINETKNIGYPTLAKAVENASNGDTVKLIHDCLGDDVSVSRNITVDFSGYSYTLNTGKSFAVSSDAILRNGSIVSEDSTLPALIQNKGKLTVDGMSLTAADGTNALSVVGTASTESASAVFRGNSTVTGRISLERPEGSSTALGLTIYDGTFNKVFAEGGAVTSLTEGCNVKISGGNYDAEPKADYIVSGYEAYRSSSRWYVGIAADDSWYTEDATEYQIFNELQLVSLARKVNSGITFEGKKVTLMADEDLSGIDWIPIGYSSRSDSAGVRFKGTFDGNAKKISNIRSIETEANMPAGLFGTVEGATIKNVIVESGTISGSDEGGAAGIVSFILGNANTTIDNCINKATVFGGCAGGIVARLYTKGTAFITDCENYGLIVAEYSQPGNKTGKAGGIAGINGSGMKCEISGCTNYGTVKDVNRVDVGGILGYMDSVSLIDDCHNHGSVVSNSAANRYAGGIVGYFTGNAGVISNCTNDASVVTKMQAGGIAGIITGAGSIDSCNNSGTIAAGGSAGGIAGSTSGSALVSCNNTASVSGLHAGGVVGTDIASTITNCNGGTGSIYSPAHLQAFTGQEYKFSVPENGSAGRIIGVVSGHLPLHTKLTLSAEYDSSVRTVGMLADSTVVAHLDIVSGTFYGNPLSGYASNIYLSEGAVWICKLEDDDWGRRAAGTYSCGGFDTEDSHQY